MARDKTTPAVQHEFSLCFFVTFHGDELLPLLLGLSLQVIILRLVSSRSLPTEDGEAMDNSSIFYRLLHFRNLPAPENNFNLNISLDMIFFLTEVAQ
jgi:hypothetical protein